MVALVGRYMPTAARHKHITGVLNMSDHKYMYYVHVFVMTDTIKASIIISLMSA